MSNFSIKIDLLKIRGSFMRNLKGSTATKKCIIIPIDGNDEVFLGEKGCYLNMTGIEMQEPKYKETHCIKPNLPKEAREAMSDEEQHAIPIIGGMYPIESKHSQMSVNGTLGQDAFSPNEDDLPF